MADKKQTTTKQKAAHVIHVGEVRGTIHVRQSNSGFSYLDFFLSRCWASRATGKEAHGSTFFEKNEQDLIQAVHEASAWIRAKMRESLASDAPNEEPSEAQ